MGRLSAAVITDIHYGVRNGRKYGNKAPRLLDLFAQAVNKKKVDFVAEMGDRIVAKNTETDRDTMTRMREHFNALAAPIYSIHGNHDLKNLSRQENAKIMGSPGGSYSKNINGFHVVFWNPDVDSRNGGLSLEQSDLDWLVHDLAKTNIPVILFSHVPLDNTGEEKDDIQKRFYYTQAPDVRKIIEDSGKVILCMAGHRHANAHKDINGVHYVTLQSLVQAQNGAGKRSPYGTYAFLDADADKGTIRIDLKGKHRKTYELGFTV